MYNVIIMGKSTTQQGICKMLIKSGVLDAHDRKLWHDHRYDNPAQSRAEAFQRVIDKRENLSEIIENNQAVKDCVIGMFKAMLYNNERSLDAFERDLYKCFNDALDGYVDVELEKMESE